MRVLVTGSRGFVGRQVCSDAKHEIVEFDTNIGLDVRNLHSLHEAMEGCDAVVHTAPVAIDNVLAAARGKRIVNVSSVDVLGVFKGERAPDYLPLDDAHPKYAATPYGRQKLEAEQLLHCHDVPTVSLRPPGIWLQRTYATIQAKRAERPSFEWDPFWEYGAFIDVHDMARACLAALTCPLDGHAALLVSAPDITTSGPTSREWAQRLHPEVEWRGGPEYAADPYRTLLDIEPAKRILNWEPRCAWEDYSDS